jgi:energy-coupling factor transport system permease protein
MIIFSFIFALVLGRMPLKNLINSMKLPVIIIIPMLVMLPLMYEWGRVGVFSFNYTWLGVSASIMITNRIFSAAMVGFGFLYTTHPRSIGQALDEIGLSYKIAHAITLSLVVFPVIEDESRKILYSHKLSGAFKIRSLTSFRKFFFCLLARLFKRMEGMVNTMECRGFGSSEQRTYLYPLIKPKSYRIIRIGSILVLVSYIAYYLSTGKPLFLLYQIERLGT